MYFSDSVLRVGKHNHDPCENWPNKLSQVCYETDFVEKFVLPGQEVQFLWHVFPGASTTDRRKEIQKFSSAVEPENFRDRIICMSKFNDIERRRKEHKESCAKTVFFGFARVKH